MRRYVPKDIYDKFESIPERYIKPTSEIRKSISNIYDIGDEYAIIIEDNSLVNALRTSIEYTGDYGKILNFHEVIKIIADHDLPKNSYASRSEEIIGIDKDGKYGESGEPVLVVTHYASIFTPERIQKGFNKQYIHKFVTIPNDIFTNLLDGLLPNDKKIHMSTPQEVGIPKNGEPFGVVIPYKEAQNSESHSKKKSFSQNKLMAARIAGCDEDTFERFYNKTKFSNGLYNTHPYKGMNEVSDSHGKLLEVDTLSCNGFDCFVEKLTGFRFIVTIPKEYGIKGINIEDAKII